MRPNNIPPNNIPPNNIPPGSLPRFASALALTTVVALSATACGPALETIRGEATWLRSSHRCAQGPFEIALQTLGTKWGEGLEAELVADHAVHARYELWIDGKRRQHGKIRTRGRVPDTQYGRNGQTSGYRWEPDKEPDNQRCIERPGELVVEEAAAPDVPAAPVSTHPGVANHGPQPPYPQPPQPPSNGPMVAPAPAQPVRVARRPVGPARLELVTVDPRRLVETHSVQFLRWHYADHGLQGAPVLGKGRPILLKVWSAQPQDWQNVRLKVVQSGDRPNVPEAEWEAHLAKEEAERKRDQAARNAEARREQQAYQAKARKRQQHCSTHLKDEDCWGKGGLAGFRLRQKQRADANQLRRAEYKRTYELNRKKTLEERARRAALPKPPTTAPPVAKAEDPGPVPSRRAEWVDGFWQWSGFTWVWLSGWWKVPEIDIRARATAVAPTAPPPLRIEVMGAPPCHGAIWMAGHWVWQAHAWMWLVGRWSLAPAGTVNLRWRAPRWVRVHKGVRLEPGRWLKVILR